MKSKSLDPRHLDIETFARAAASLTGQWAVAALPRLAQATLPEGGEKKAERVVAWSAKGRTVQRAGAQPQIWMDLHAETAVALQCQRCLRPMEVPLDVERSLRFVPDEQQAAELDADSEEDVLAMTRNLDLLELVEDELILELPIVPRHELCPEVLAVPPSVAELGEGETADTSKPNPFAALAALKRGAKS